MTGQSPSPTTPPRQGAPVNLTGLLLAGRKVVAVGGGHVHARRVPKLLAAGADVVVVAPQLHPGLAALAASGQITWHEREFEDSDLDAAWYVLAATDDPQVNAQVAAAAEARHTFCVRADRGEAGTAWTPATAAVHDATIAVQASHDPMHDRALRDRLVQLLGEAGE